MRARLPPHPRGPSRPRYPTKPYCDHHPNPPSLMPQSTLPYEPFACKRACRQEDTQDPRGGDTEREMLNKTTNKKIAALAVILCAGLCLERTATVHAKRSTERHRGAPGRPRRGGGRPRGSAGRGWRCCCLGPRASAAPSPCPPWCTGAQQGPRPQSRAGACAALGLRGLRGRRGG